MFVNVKKFPYVVMEQVGRPTHVVEVGTFNPLDLEVLPFVFDTGCRVQLFEPQPECAERLIEFFKKAEFRHIEITQVALGAAFAQTTLYVPVPTRNNPDAAASAFLSTESPYRVRSQAGKEVEELKSIRVSVEPLSAFDDGTIQALSIDVEGAEWEVLSTLVSRPAVISIELWGQEGYVTPGLVQIEHWMAQNGYTLHDRTETDAIYIFEEMPVELNRLEGIEHG
jgi:FkbM family methyltransferase